MPHLLWDTDYDDQDNTTWYAAGPYEEGFEYRIKQRVRADKHEFYEASDPELLMDEDEPKSWTTIEAAKAEMEKDCAEAIESYDRTTPRPEPK